MKKPNQCILWTHPELAFSNMLDKTFECIATFVDESHFWRYLLKCRECGQLYFYQFYEEIDWENGNDPQYVNLIPVETEEDIKLLKNSNELELCLFLPRLYKKFPKNADKPTVYWIGK